MNQRNIIRRPKLKKPDSFFQFQRFDKENYSINNLKEHSIFFSDPRGFNDPYDAKPNLISVEINGKKELDKVIKKLWPKASKAVKDEMSTMSDEKLIKMITSKWKELIEVKFSDCGVSCFTEKIENNVFWYSYSENHTGFCLEFHPETHLFERVFKVKYSNNYPIIDASLIGFENRSFTTMIDQIFTFKSEEWSYENEWRLIHKDKLFSYEYNPSTLKGVSLGKDCSAENEKIVRAILSDSKFEHVDLFRMEMTSKSYLLNKVKIN